MVESRIKGSADRRKYLRNLFLDRLEMFEILYSSIENQGLRFPLALEYLAHMFGILGCMG
jgi:hypothetical protein